MQFAQLSILVFGCIAAASAAPQLLISLSSASLQEEGSRVEGNPDSSSVVHPNGTGQKPTLQDTSKLQSTHGVEEGEFLKVVDAIMKAVKLHTNGNNQQSSGTELSQGTDVIEITTEVISGSTNSVNEHSTDVGAKAAVTKILQNNGSKVEQTSQKVPLNSNFDQIFKEINAIKKGNEKVTESPENKDKQIEVIKEINEVSSKQFQGVRDVEILPIKGDNIEIATEVTPPRKDNQVILESQKIVGQESPLEAQQSKFAVKETVTEAPLVEANFIATQTNQVNTEKTKEREPVESVTLLGNKENISENHAQLEGSFVSDNDKKSSHVLSETETSTNDMTDVESTFKNQEKSVVGVEVTTEILNDPISDIVQSVSQVFDTAIPVPKRPTDITKKLEAEELTVEHVGTKLSDIFTTTAKGAKVELDTVQRKDIFTPSVRTPENSFLGISSLTTTSPTAESTTSQGEISSTTSLPTPQVIEIVKGPTNTFTTTGKGINKPSLQGETTPKLIGFTSFPFKEPTGDTTAQQNTIKFSKPVHKPFSPTASGKSFTSNFIEDHNQVASSHISNHFGFDNPSLMNTLSHKTFMFHGVPTDPKTLVPAQYRNFIYYNDAPEVTAAKIAFFRFQASLSPIPIHL